MFFSVIIPVYNVEPYLARAVDSVLGQDYSGEFEIILVDDGSTDKSGSMCDAYAQKDARIRVLHKENGGLSSARNAGMKIATGEYIVFLDSDDWIDTDALMIFSKNLKEGCADILEFSFKHVFSGGEIELEKTKNCNKGTVLLMKDLPSNLTLGPTVWRQVFRRSFLEKHGFCFCNGIFSEDVLFSAQVSCKAERVIFIDYHGYNYFYSNSSITRNMDLKNISKRLDDYCFIYKNLLDLGSTPTLNFLQKKRINFSIYRSVFNFFRQVLSKPIPLLMAQEYFKQLQKMNLYPLPPWSSDVRCRFYRLLTQLHCPLVLLRFIYRMLPTEKPIWDKIQHFLTATKKWITKS